jgi:hypothetical protein
MREEFAPEGSRRTMDSVTAEQFLNSYHNSSPPPSPDVPEDLASFMLAADHPPMRGWFAVPLIGSDGENHGFVQACDRLEGEFTEQDETYLVRLAALTPTALDALAQLHLPGLSGGRLRRCLPGRHRTRPGLPRGG